MTGFISCYSRAEGLGKVTYLRPILHMPMSVCWGSEVSCGMLYGVFSLTTQMSPWIGAIDRSDIIADYHWVWAIFCSIWFSWLRKVIQSKFEFPFSHLFWLDFWLTYLSESSLILCEQLFVWMFKSFLFWLTFWLTLSLYVPIFIHDTEMTKCLTKHLTKHLTKCLKKKHLTKHLKFFKIHSVFLVSFILEKQF
jgi:hypothetical protein